MNYSWNSPLTRTYYWRESIGHAFARDSVCLSWWRNYTFGIRTLIPSFSQIKRAMSQIVRLLPRLVRIASSYLDLGSKYKFKQYTLNNNLASWPPNLWHSLHSPIKKVIFALSFSQMLKYIQASREMLHTYGYKAPCRLVTSLYILYEFFRNEFIQQLRNFLPKKQCSCTTSHD